MSETMATVVSVIGPRIPGAPDTDAARPVSGGLSGTLHRARGVRDSVRPNARVAAPIPRGQNSSRRAAMSGATSSAPNRCGGMGTRSQLTTGTRRPHLDHGESDPMLDTHAVARSLTAADFTPAQADALTTLSGWSASRATTSRPTSSRPA